MALHCVFCSPPLLSQIAGLLGLDHRSRAALEAAVRLPVEEFRRWPALVTHRRGFAYAEPFVRLRARALPGAWAPIARRGRLITSLTARAVCASLRPIPLSGL